MLVGSAPQTRADGLLALPPGLKWTFDRQSCSLALTIAY
jgi:hypothetical protein